PLMLPAVISCVNARCPSTNNLLVHSTVDFTPKIQYSCQMSLAPNSEEPSSTLTLNGAGDCETSPYDFQSFVAGGSTGGLASACSLVIYDWEGCQGAAATLPMASMPNEACQFHGGRSASLNCTGRLPRYVELLYVPSPLHVSLADGDMLKVATTHLLSMCSNATSSAGNSSSTTFTTSSGLTAISTTPISVNSATSTNGTATQTSSPPNLPLYTDSAGMSRACASVAGLIGVLAAFALL
ncbi:hypothetical protein LTR36_002618, partial [Oleoguttula mirabilis]